MGVDYVLGLVNSIDGERDPRNLDFIFEFMPKFISQFDMFHMAEEMFEVFCCYFPIDFNPSSDDPGTITRDRLADKLANCLVASESFVEWLVSLALEKLESDLSVAKIDSLDVLQRAAVKFPPATLATFFEQIWTALKPHIFPGSDNAAVLNAAMQLLRALLEQSAKDKDISQQQQTAVLGVILPHLSDVQQRLFDPAASIALVCVAGDAVYAAPKILSVFLIKLNSLSAAEDEQRMKIYANIAQIFKIASLKEALTKMLGDQICVELQQNVIGHLAANTVIVELQRLALSVLAESSLITAEPERALIYRYLTQQVRHESAEWLAEGTQLLERLAALHPIEIQTHYMDVCMQKFTQNSAAVQYKILKSLLPLVRQMAFTQRILDLLFENMFGLENQTQTRCISLEALNILLQQEDKHFVVELQHNTNLLDKLVSFRLVEADPDDTYWQLIEQLSLALSLIVQHLDIAEQYLIVTECLQKYQFDGEPKDLYVTYGILCQLHMDISLDDFIENLLKNILATAVNVNGQKRLRERASKLLCILVNKTQTTTTAWSVLLQQLSQLIAQLEASEEAIEAVAWFAKGLIVRGANEAEEIIEKLAALLWDPQRAKCGVHAFEIITNDYKQVHLPNVKFLYKQKFLHLFMQAIKQKISCLSDECVNVFMQILKTTPHAVLRINIGMVNQNKLVSQRNYVQNCKNISIIFAAGTLNV